MIKCDISVNRRRTENERKATMSKLFLSICIILLLCVNSGCMGRTPELVKEQLPEDASKDCKTLGIEIQTCDKNIIDRYHKGKDATSTAVGVGVLAYILFPPAALFMDVSGADYEEMGAFQKRREYLLKLAEEKHCEECSSVMSEEALLEYAQAEYDRSIVAAKKESAFAGGEELKQN